MALRYWRQKVWEAVFDHARKAHATNHYMQAEIFYNLALALANHIDVEPADMAKLLVSRGELFLAKQAYDKAEDAFRQALLMYDKNSLGTEIDMAIALKDMSVTFRIQGKHCLASQLNSLAQQYTADTRSRLEKCFEIPAA